MPQVALVRSPTSPRAQFTVAQMREKLDLKKKGQCTCGDRDVLCRTMCGTLLGPNAKDVTTETPRAAGP